MKSTRGDITIILLLLAGASGGFVLGSWKPLNAFKKPPPTAQLTDLQAKLAAQQAQAAQAAKDAEAAKVAERQKLEAQVRAAQQDNLGAETALKKVPAAYRTPEVNLALRMTQRVSLKLAAAIGRLPAEDQDAMIELIEQALSDKQAEVDEANRKLAELDAQFSATTKARQQLEAQIPLLTKQAQDAAKQAQETQAAVTVKTQEVKTWADKANAALHENGSLWSTLKRGALVIGAIWAFLTIGIPAIVKHLEPGNRLKTPLRDLSGYLMNPLVHHDAKKKLAASQSQPPQP